MELENVLNFFGAVVCSLVIVGVFFLSIRATLKRNYLQKQGLTGVAKILKMNDTMIKYGTGSFAQPLMEIILEVQEKGSDAVKQVGIKQAFQTSDIPSVGAWVSILIDPNDRNNIMIDQRSSISDRGKRL
jgi:hypothetical protein